MFRVFSLVLCLALAGLIAWAAAASPEAMPGAARLFIAGAGGASGTVHAALAGGEVVAYPAWADGAALAAAVVLALAACRQAFRTEPFSLADAGRGALALILASAAARLLAGARMGLTGVDPAFADRYFVTAPFHLDRIALAVLIAGAVAASFAAAGFGRSRYFSAFAGAFALGLILALGLRAMDPAAAVMAGWTLLYAAAVAAALALRWNGERGRASALVFAALLGGVFLAQLAYLARPFEPGASADGLAAFTALAALALFPLAWPRTLRLASPARL